MKSKLLLVIICVLLAGFAWAQDVIVIPGGLEHAGELEATINADTSDTGERANPDRIYELEANQFYIIHAAINFQGADGTLTIRGQEGGTKPVIIRVAVSEVEPGTHQINGNLRLENIQYELRSMTDQLNWNEFNITGDNHHLYVDNCMMEETNGLIFNLDNVSAGAEVVIKNSYFRDLFIWNQWWAARVVNGKVPIDNFEFTNNTVSGGGLTVLGQECLIERAVINHNTFINNHKYPFLNQYWKECYFTNNLFVNANFVGEDRENVATGGQDPDGLLEGITGVDTLENTILIQPKFLNEDSSLTAEVDELEDIIYYAADNIVVYSPELDEWFSGAYNDVAGYDYPLSYLTWSGLTGPFQIVNIPGIFQNERSQTLCDTYANIVEENNSVYELSDSDLGLGTDVLTADGADVFARWNNVQWGVPGAEAPLVEEYTKYSFGDKDPATIPGIETEDGAGISKISDMIEDFSISDDYVSMSDGLKIGAQHWDDLAFDAEASLADVKAAYQTAVSVEEETVAPVEFTLAQNYPNPFNPATSINFTLAKNAQVKLTVYNVSGQQVATLVNTRLNAGSHDITWDASNLSSGVYFYTMEVANQYKVTRKMMLVK